MINKKRYMEYLNSREVKRPIYKVELLRRDETVKKELTSKVVSGSGSVQIENRSGVRRTSDFTLVPTAEDRKYFSNLALGDKFKLWVGYNIDGEDYFPSPAGVFVFDNPTFMSMPDDKTIQIAGSDKWSILNGENGGILESTYTVEAETTIKDFITRTLNLSIVNDPVPPVIDVKLLEEKTTYEITKSAGETVADLMLDVAENLSAEIYYDQFGRLNVWKTTDDMFKASLFDFNHNAVSYFGGQKEYNLRDIYNAVMVIADNPQNKDVPFESLAVNNDLTDKNSVPNLGFTKTLVVTDRTDGISTQEQCDDRAFWELKKAKIRYSTVEMEGLMIPHLDVNQICTVTDPELVSDRERFLITSITHTIGEAYSSYAVSKAVSY